MKRYYCDNCKKLIPIDEETHISIKFGGNECLHWELCPQCRTELEMKIFYLMKDYGNPF